MNFPITITKGSRFALREGGKTIAAGIVTEILPEDYQIDFGKVKKGLKNIEGQPGQPVQSAQTETQTAKTSTDAKKVDAKAAQKSAPQQKGK